MYEPMALRHTLWLILDMLTFAFFRAVATETWLTGCPPLMYPLKWNHPEQNVLEKLAICLENA